MLITYSRWIHLTTVANVVIAIRSIVDPVTSGTVVVGIPVIIATYAGHEVFINTRNEYLATFTTTLTKAAGTVTEAAIKAYLGEVFFIGDFNGYG